MMLAALKGALCLTMSAIDTVPDSEFAQMMLGLVAMFSRKGWMVLLWGIVCLPIGFAMQAIPLVKTRAIPRWQGILFLIGILLVGTPDGLEIVNLTACILMAFGLVPYGIQTIRNYSA
jgi:energy-coupling factor transporter transmembrane protein EcfT